jgi:hypothetical protein
VRIYANPYPASTVRYSIGWELAVQELDEAQEIAWSRAVKPFEEES